MIPIRLGVNAKSSNDIVCLYGIKTASMALPIGITKTKFDAETTSATYRIVVGKQQPCELPLQHEYESSGRSSH